MEQSKEPKSEYEFYKAQYNALKEKYDNILATESGHESKTENVWQSGYAAGHEVASEKYKSIQAKCDKYEAALKHAKDALENSYDVLSYPATGETMQDMAIIAITKALSAGEGEKEPSFSSDQVIGMLIEFAIAYYKSPNKDISNDAAEYLYDLIKPK